MRSIYLADINSLVGASGNIQGHYIAVFQNYSEVLGQSTDVYVCGGPAYGKIFRNHFLSLPCNATLGGSSFKNKISNFINVRYLLKIAKEQTVIFQSSALAMVWLGIFLFGCKGTRIFVINYTARMGRLARLFYRLAMHKITGNICTLDEVGKMLERPYLVVPDYIYTRAGVPEIRPETGMQQDFAIVGIVNRSKGVLEAARRFVGAHATLTIKGRVMEEALEKELSALARENKNIEFVPGYLDNKNFVDTISQSRFVILNYSDDYSSHTSGVVYDILFSGCPVVGRHCKSLEFIGKNGMGALYESIEDWQPDVFLEKIDRKALERNIEVYLRKHRQIAQMMCDFVTGTPGK